MARNIYDCTIIIIIIIIINARIDIYIALNHNNIVMRFDVTELVSVLMNSTCVSVRVFVC
jgi:hypothetical protein